MLNCKLGYSTHRQRETGEREMVATFFGVEFIQQRHVSASHLIGGLAKKINEQLTAQSKLECNTHFALKPHAIK